MRSFHRKEQCRPQWEDQSGPFQRRGQGGLNRSLSSETWHLRVLLPLQTFTHTAAATALTSGSGFGSLVFFCLRPYLPHLLCLIMLIIALPLVSNTNLPHPLPSSLRAGTVSALLLTAWQTVSAQYLFLEIAVERPCDFKKTAPCPHAEK